MKSAGLFVMILAVLGSVCWSADWVGMSTVDSTDWFDSANWNPDIPTVADNSAIGSGMVNVYSGVEPFVAECKGLNIGSNDVATVNILSGGQLISASGGMQFVTGYNASGVGDINVYGMLSIGNGPFVARRGASNITVYDGGYVLGKGSMEMQGGDGTITVLEGGTWRQKGEMKISRYQLAGTDTMATINVDGGTVECGGTLGMGRSVSADATLDISAGLMLVGYASINRDLYVGQDMGTESATVKLSGTGRLIVTSQIRTNAPGAALFEFTGGQLSVRNWNASQMGELVNEGGILSPAGRVYNGVTDTYTIDETGEIDISYAAADYVETTPDCAIQVDIEGTSQGVDYDYFDFSGGAFLQGELIVTLRGEYVLMASELDTFTIMETDGFISGGFWNLDEDSRVWAFDEFGGYVGSYLVTIGESSIVLSDLNTDNEPPVITADDINTYIGSGSILVEAEVTNSPSFEGVSYSWSVIEQPEDSVIDPNVTFLTTKDIVFDVDTVGEYVLELRATDDGGKYSLKQILVSVSADSCEAAKKVPGFVLLDGDVNEDCNVDMADLALMAADWIVCEDMDGDCYVDMADFALMAANWMNCNAIDCE